MVVYAHDMPTGKKSDRAIILPPVPIGIVEGRHEETSKSLDVDEKPSPDSRKPPAVNRPRRTTARRANTDVERHHAEEAGSGQGQSVSSSGDEPVAAAQGPIPDDRKPSSVDARPGNLESQRRDYALTVRRAIMVRGRYPAMARRRGIEGRTVVVIEVDESGMVAGVHIEESSRYAVLDRTALSLARTIGSLPPPPGGAMEVIVPVDFNLKKR